jgi:serine/threonine protein kinase
MHSLAFLCGVLHRDCRIIHADLKPSNLILPHERIPIAIIDFGSSWQIEKTRYRHDGDGHDRYFAAPEVFAGESVVDGRIDQFSIGMILYKMLTGKVAYDGLGGQAGVGVENIREMESILVPPSQFSATMGRLPAEVAKAIDDLVIRSLRLIPRDRFSTMQSFANELKSIQLAMERKQISSSEAKKANGLKTEKKPWYWNLLS